MLMSSIQELIRPEIRKLRPYRSAEFQDGLVRLNANETPWRPPGDPTATGLNRYPEPRPAALTTGLAAYYGVSPAELLVTRGSSEGIDLLIRGFCRPGENDVVICPPTFGMYEVYAQVQGAGVRAVPLLREQGYALDVEGIGRAWDERARLLFVCSPNNPTGNRFPDSAIGTVAERIRGRGVVVVDAAYAEFADADPTRELLRRHDHVVVLRTLSKAMGLAGLRCGAVLGPPQVLDLLSCILPPFSFPTLCAELVARCLEPGQEGERARHISLLKTERARLAEALSRLPGVTRVWPSEANFLLIEAKDPSRLVKAAKAGGVLVRDFSWDPYLPGCIRITVGDVSQNDQLLRAWSTA
jgi:histidinol-phosphate aminotransferase